MPDFIRNKYCRFGDSLESLMDRRQSIASHPTESLGFCVMQLPQRESSSKEKNNPFSIEPTTKLAIAETLPGLLFNNQDALIEQKRVVEMDTQRNKLRLERQVLERLCS